MENLTHKMLLLLFSNRTMLIKASPRGKPFCLMNRPNTAQLLTSRLGGESHGEMCSSRSRKVKTKCPLAASPLLDILCSESPLAALPTPLPSLVLGALLHHSSLPVPISQHICHHPKHKKNPHSTSPQPALVPHSPYVLPLPKHVHVLWLRNSSQTGGALGEQGFERKGPCHVN